MGGDQGGGEVWGGGSQGSRGGWVESPGVVGIYWWGSRVVGVKG